MYIGLLRVSARARLETMLLVLTLGLFAGSSVALAFEPTKTPAKPVPSSRWGALKPGAILGDSTFFAFHRDPRQTEPFYFGVDIENGWVFATTGRGLQIFDANSNPAAPPLVGYGYGPSLTNQGPGGLMPAWYQSDEDWFLQDIDAPPGNDKVAAIASWGQGFSIWDTSDKTAPKVHYQDEGVSATSVYSAYLGNTPYAFVLSSSGAYHYDLAVAQTKARCLDNSGTGSLPCAGVYKGKLAGVSGVALAGVGPFIAVAKTTAGFEIWNVSTPSSPVKVMGGGSAARGVALWQNGTSYYLATGNFGKVRIYDVSCIAGGTCSVPTELTILNVPNGSPPISRVTVSKASGGTPYLYVSGSDTFSCATQREYLFNVSNPSSPVDITSAQSGGGYWGWYYELCSSGFNWVSPQMGKFYGNDFYRAAYSILDVHQLALAQPPTASFTWSPQTDIYPGTPVQFTDQSTGSPAPTAWDWTFADASAAASNAQNPSVSFNTPGVKSVSLTSRSAQGPSSPVAKTLTVLDPTPKIGELKVSPASPVACQPITVTANGVTGPGLSYSWALPNAAPAPTVLNVNPLVWTTTASTSPGTYSATLTVSNSHGSAAKSVNVVVGALQAINPSFTPTNDSFSAGTVKFHDNQPAGSATEWSWDFDDDGNAATIVWGPWTSDPVNGPAPMHSYATKGHKIVRLRVRNCTTPDQATGIVSLPLDVNVTVVTPLTAHFSASCSGGACFVDAGQSITFFDSSTGAELWDYDWDGNGSFEDAGNTVARTSHAYSSQGNFTPKLRVRRGAEQDVFTLQVSILVGAPTPGSISVSGPGSGQANQPLSFTASGGGSCNPSAGGWSWTAPGGTVTDGSTATASIKWGSDGSKSITVTNSACANVSGSKTVTIGNVTPPPPPPPPPSGLKAEFTFTPAAAVLNQAVSFNGASSSGNPTSYVWDFGDGSPLAIGAQVTHAFTQSRSYPVQLTVTGPGSCPPAPFCSASTTKTVSVGSGETPLVPAFQTSASCINEFGVSLCTADRGAQVTFTDQSTGGPTSWSWDFGDGGTATGATASHTFATANNYNVTLTVRRGSTSASAVQSFRIIAGPVEPPPPPPASVVRSVVLPWIAQTRGVLVQSSDLYVNNPGKTVMDVTLEFRKRGVPDTTPPRISKTIQPGATLYIGDVLKELFARENVAGFISVKVDKGDAEPIITSFNTTFQTDGRQFGQTVSGVSMSSTGSAAGTGPESRVQHLVGLVNNTERLAYFGLSNPTEENATYRLRFFDKTGKLISESSQDLTLSRFGQRQYQVKELHDVFGISSEEDYRVEIETKAGGRIVPYASNLRLSSEDPSFIEAGSSKNAKVYLLGVLSVPGLNNSLWRSDVLLSNTTSQQVSADLTFTSVGLTGAPTTPLHVTLQPGRTERLENVIAGQWAITNAIGVLTISSTAAGGVFPIVQGESYENTNPLKRFGQSMTAVSEADAAAAGKSQYLVGMRQDAKNRTTLWLFNPGSVTGQYDVVYRGLDGKELGRFPDVQLGAGKMRQFSPGQHKLPAAGVVNGFTVEIVVKGGKVLSAAQVINNVTNDPAYIKGEVR